MHIWNLCKGHILNLQSDNLKIFAMLYPEEVNRQGEINGDCFCCAGDITLKILSSLANRQCPLVLGMWEMTCAGWGRSP
jgi:hypothetical protein